VDCVEGGGLHVELRDAQPEEGERKQRGDYP
jgi:hypothetical protein